jgi:hypothetical protein
MDTSLSLRLENGGGVAQRGTPDGGAVIAHHLDLAIARGMGRIVTVGGFSSGIVGGGAGTVLDLDQPELVIGVPAGYCIKPVRLSCQLQTGLIAADNDENEILFAVDSLGLWSGDGTFTGEEPSNMRTDLKKGSACRVGSAFTADMTTTPSGAAAADPVLDIELARHVSHIDVSTAVGVNYKIDDLLYEPKYGPLLVGPCSLLVYFGGTVANIGGFVQAAWIEGPVSEFFTR